jgi:hypothetical protein
VHYTTGLSVWTDGAGSSYYGNKIVHLTKRCSERLYGASDD